MGANKQLVTAGKLADLLTAHIQSEMGDDTCKVDIPRRLEQPDELGCNWEITWASCAESKVEFEEYISDTIKWARHHYNICNQLADCYL